jgi:hypothetical protein
MEGPKVQPPIPFFIFPAVLSIHPWLFFKKRRIFFLALRKEEGIKKKNAPLNSRVR